MHFEEFEALILSKYRNPVTLKVDSKGEIRNLKKQIHGLLVKSFSSSGIWEVKNHLGKKEKKKESWDIIFALIIKNADINWARNEKEFVRNLSKGDGNKKLVIAIYYWFHTWFKKNEETGEQVYPYKKLAYEIDKSLFDRYLDEEFNQIIPEATTTIPSKSNKKAVKSLELPLIHPPYVMKKVDNEDENDEKEISLNAYDHYSIPLFSRKEELKQLDDFLDQKDKIFSIMPIIGPSGSGKTRLVSEWFRKVDEEQWQAGFVNTSNKSPWEDWTPICNTLIIIDYVYRFDEVINLILKAGENSKQHKIRLIIIDHVFPKDLDNLTGGHFDKVFFSRDIKSVKSRTDFFHPTMYLEKAKNRLDILSKIIACVSEKPEKCSKVKNAVKLLQTMGSSKKEKKSDSDTTIETQENDSSVSAAAHPLFAILIGKALKAKQPIKHWKRHELIDFYLNNLTRPPWEIQDDQKDVDPHGQWVAAFVAVATVRRGLSFETLNDCLSEVEKNYTKNDFKRIAYWCNGIVSSEDNEKLKQFEPDILGESFFLLFFEHFRRNETVHELFIKMMCAEDEYLYRIDEEPEDASQTFIEFIRRLARNLANDDQKSTHIKDAWKTLAKFLNPKLYDKYPPYRLVVTFAIIEVSDILEEKNYSELNKLFFMHINEDELISISSGKLYKEIAYAFTKYYDRCDRSQRIQPNLQDKLFKIYQNFEAQSKDGSKRLMVASHLGCLKVANLLIDKGDSIDDINNNKMTALMLASQKGHKVIVELLYKKANLNLQDRSKRTALMIASEKGYTAIVELLYKKTNLNLQDKYKWTALMIASFEGYRSIVKLLLKTANLDMQNCDKWTALMLASQEGHTAIIELLLEEGAKTDLQDTGNWTALMLASQEGHKTIASLLINKGAYVDLSCKNSLTVLMYKSIKGNSYDVTTFSQTQIDKAVYFPNFFTPLFFGNWKNLDVSAIKNISQRLMNSRYSFILLKTGLQSIRSIKPSFYPDGEFFELLFNSDSKKVTKNKDLFTECKPLTFDESKFCSLVIFLIKDNIRILSGVSDTIYSLNDQGYLSISKKNIINYLKFFYSSNSTETCVFRVFRSIDDIIFNDTSFKKLVGFNEYEKIKSSLKPLDIIPEKDGGFFIKNCIVLNEKHLFLIDFIITPNGYVDMFDDTILSQELPIGVETFEQGFRSFKTVD